MNSMIFRLIFMLVLALGYFKASGQCTSDAGTMSLVLIEVCATETATANASSGANLDGDDILQFFLHTASGNSLGTVLSTNSSPQFSFNSGNMIFGVTYYISAVVGNDDGTGNVDLTDPCIDVAAGTPVRWLQPPTATMDNANFVVCAGDPTQVTATIFFTGTAPWTLEWSVNGQPQASLSIASNPFLAGFWQFFWQLCNLP
ncbi:MAG: hypothetical protein IPM82_30590 [Saprospiraceae bacterium]|nr:hypothetical protein [Saprospiraceae bacterium]